MNIVPINQEQPELLWSTPQDPLYEDDCACSNWPFHVALNESSSSDTEILWQRSPNLYKQELNIVNDLFFNPNGSLGPIVLNHAAQNILNAFAFPMSIQGGIKTIRNVQVEKALTIVQHMIVLGLLFSPSYRKPLKQTSKM